MYAAAVFIVIGLVTASISSFFRTSFHNTDFSDIKEEEDNDDDIKRLIDSARSSMRIFGFFLIIIGVIILLIGRIF